MVTEAQTLDFSCDGRPVARYALTAGGRRATILTLGGVLETLETPDRDGRIDDVVVGFGDAAAYLDNRPFFGALVGRYANRIARGELPVGGVVHRLARNDGGRHHLHGGPRGFHTKIWDVLAVDDGAAPAITLRHLSPDGDEGYPGALEARVTYTLTPAGALRIAYEARADRLTAVNLTQHAYFNLGGAGAGAPDILGHELSLAAARFLPIDDGAIPTGALADVRGTPFDFLRATPIGARIDAADDQLGHGHGYDHCFAVDGWDGSLRAVAELREPRSGRRMQVRTTEPGVQLYTGNHLAGTAGKRGVSYAARAGLCLEAQHFPDSPHRPDFPPTLLAPGDTYRQITEYVFPAP